MFICFNGTVCQWHKRSVEVLRLILGTTGVIDIWINRQMTHSDKASSVSLFFLVYD